MATLAYFIMDKLGVFLCIGHGSSHGKRSARVSMRYMPCFAVKQNAQRKPQGISLVLCPACAHAQESLAQVAMSAALREAFVGAPVRQWVMVSWVTTVLVHRTTCLPSARPHQHQKHRPASSLFVILHPHMQASVMPVVTEALRTIARDRPQYPLKVLAQHLLDEAEKVGAAARPREEHAHAMQTSPCLASLKMQAPCALTQKRRALPPTLIHTRTPFPCPTKKG